MTTKTRLDNAARNAERRARRAAAAKFPHAPDCETADASHMPCTCGAGSKRQADRLVADYETFDTLLADTFCGYISQQHTIWCGCGRWEQLDEKREAAIRCWRTGGWKLTKALGWVCPRCTKKGKTSAPGLSSQCKQSFS